MYYGKVTDELEKLYKEYYDMFSVEPSFYEELEYAQESYDEFIADIKKAIKEHKELPDAVGCYDDFDFENECY